MCQCFRLTTFVFTYYCLFWISMNHFYVFIVISAYSVGFCLIWVISIYPATLTHIIQYYEFLSINKEEEVFIIVALHEDHFTPTPLSRIKDGRLTSSKQCWCCFTSSSSSLAHTSHRLTSTRSLPRRAKDDNVSTRLLQACEILTREFPHVVASVKALEG